MKLTYGLLLLLLTLLIGSTDFGKVVLAAFTAADRTGYGLAALVLIAAAVTVHRGIAAPGRRAAVVR